ncbi:MAG TPA: hypothetical protein VK074_06895 [Fodinibius sp.]|nr:hypothetical protein [Fodinibius sp.]
METNKNLDMTEVAEGKNVAIIAYLTLIGLIIAFILNNDKKNGFASYHIRQSLGLCVTGLALWIVGLIPFLGWLISIIGSFVLLYMWVMGLMKAINGKRQPIPILGDRYSEWFSGL